jgi:hypothetical protein
VAGARRAFLEEIISRIGSARLVTATRVGSGAWLGFFLNHFGAANRDHGATPITTNVPSEYPDGGLRPSIVKSSWTGSSNRTVLSGMKTNFSSLSGMLFKRESNCAGVRGCLGFEETFTKSVLLINPLSRSSRAAEIKFRTTLSGEGMSARKCTSRPRSRTKNSAYFIGSFFAQRQR